MFKKMISIALIACMMLTFAACGEEEKTVDLAAVKQEIVSTLGITATDMNTVIMVNMYGLPESGIAESACFTAPGEVFNEEIFMFKATDSANADTIEQKLNTRLDSLKKQSQNYSPETAAVLEKASVLRNGNYVAFFFSGQRETMESIYQSHF